MRLVGAHGADQPGGVPGGAAAELDPLQQHDIGPAQLGQMIGDAGTDNAAADDDGAGACRNLIRHGKSPLVPEGGY